MRRSRTGPYYWSRGSEAVPTSLSPVASVATATRGGQQGSAAAHGDEIPIGIVPFPAERPARHPSRLVLSLLCPARARSVFLGENHADVVLAPVSIRARDQCFACCLEVHAPLENQLCDVVIVHHIGQPVGAEQQRVPALPGDRVQVGNGRSAAETAGDLMAEGMRAGLP
jgi:hypothetical protein